MNPTIHIQPDADGTGYIIKMVDSEGNRYQSVASYANIETARHAVGVTLMGLNRAKVFTHEREVPAEAPVAGIGDPDDDGVNIMTMTVPELDAFAESEGIDDYPKSDNKPTKLTFLSNWLEQLPADEPDDGEDA